MKSRRTKHLSHVICINDQYLPVAGVNTSPFASVLINERIQMLLGHCDPLEKRIYFALDKQ